MKIALIADIHGNYPALQAVLADIERLRPDKLLVLGDLVFKGPQPRECVERIRALNVPVLQGNIDELVGKNQIQPGFAKSPEQEQALRREMEWTRARLDADQLEYLAQLPFSHTMQLADQLTLRCIHANPHNLLDIILPTADQEQLAGMFAGADAQLLAYAHIHQPYVRMFAGRAIFNTGSVGLPFDGDPRSSYALVETSDIQPLSDQHASVADYQITIRRVRYDVEATVRAYAGSGHPFADSVIQAIRTGTRPV
jgi:predicted phosphodiesterase